MSTILRALKKLEQDKETIGARGMSGIASTAADRNNRRPGRAWMSIRVLRAAVIGAVLIGVFFIAVYFYTQSGTKSNQALQPSETAQKTSRPRQADTAPRPMDRLEGDPRPPKQPPGQVKPVPQRKLPSKQPPQSPIAGTGAPPKPALRPERIKSGDRQETGLDPRRAIAPGTVTAPDTATGAAGKVTEPAEPIKPAKPVPPAGTNSEQNSEYAAADRLTDNRLKIQAIVWSSIPDERMAVINTHIVREGGSVEGFLVVSIRSDDVIVRENGRLYKVVFGKP